MDGREQLGRRLSLLDSGATEGEEGGGEEEEEENLLLRPAWRNNIVSEVNPRS